MPKLRRQTRPSRLLNSPPRIAASKSDPIVLDAQSSTKEVLERSGGNRTILASHTPVKLAMEAHLPAQIDLRHSDDRRPFPALRPALAMARAVNTLQANRAGIALDSLPTNY